MNARRTAEPAKEPLPQSSSRRLRLRPLKKRAATIWVLLAIFPPLVYEAECAASWQVEWEKTVIAAEKEGQLVISIGSGPLTKQEPLDAFQKAYPKIQVTTVRGRGSQLGPRIIAERRAARYLVDLVVTGKDTAFATLYMGKLLDPIKPALLLPEVVDQSKWWQGKHKYADREGQYIFVFTGIPGGANVTYNTKLVNIETLQSYWDLVHPKWKGKIVAFDPRIAGAGTTSIFLFYHPALGPNYMRRLYGEMDVTLARDYRQSTDWLAQGKFAICVPCPDVTKAIHQGLPIAEAPGFKEGEVMSSKGGTLSLVNRAPHPNAAKVFINWLLSKEGQIEIQKGGQARSDQYDSLRMDIPKDIPEDVRRKEGVTYFDSDDPRFADRTPVDRLLREILR